MPSALLTLVLMPLGLEALPLAVMAKGIDAMMWRRALGRRACPARCSRPAIPTASLRADGRRRLVADAVADALALAGPRRRSRSERRWRRRARPDILAGRDGRSSPSRGADGELRRWRAPRANFELERWLEHDGDRRSREEAAKAAGFRCDGAGCIGDVKGLRVAVARHPSALRRGLPRGAAILIVAARGPRGCTAPAVVIDCLAARRGGTHALYLDADGRHPHRDGGGAARHAPLDHAGGHAGRLAAERRTRVPAAPPSTQ